MYVILKTTVWGKHHYPCFNDEEIERQRGHKVAQGKAKIWTPRNPQVGPALQLQVTCLQGVKPRGLLAHPLPATGNINYWSFILWVQNFDTYLNVPWEEHLLLSKDLGQREQEGTWVY